MSARVMIIEDNEANLELMRYLLEAFDFTPLLARDGEEGVRLTAAEIPDLVLCDVQLPGIDGYEVLRRIRSDRRLAAIPVVAVTALAMVGDRDRALDAGFDGYMAKPIDPESFVPQVVSFLSRGTHAAPAKVHSTPSPVPQVVRAAKALTILALDNVPSQLELIRSLFGTLGYRVVAATLAREALNLARISPPDLIISDVCMPEGSGYDFIEAVKADDALRSIPFVFLTSTMANEEERRKGLALGAAKFLFRPIEPRQLLDEVEQCLAQRSRA
jgi:two-component system cell cycle response regulator